jgi:hypothetical protein
MTQDEIQKMLDNISEYVNVELTDAESEQRHDRRTKGGDIQGQSHKENGTGVCGRTQEEMKMHAKMGGDWCKEKGIIQETQYRSSQIEYECTCGEKGKGNLFKSLHFENCGKRKKQSATREYQVIDNGVVIHKFYKRQDIYDWHSASKWMVNQILAGRREDETYGYTYKTVNIEKNK